MPSAPARERPRRPAAPASAVPRGPAEFYRLRREPFDGAPDPHEVVLAGTAREALEVLERGLARGDAALLLTAAPGLGKTTLARVLAARAEPDGVRAVWVHHPRLGFDDLLKLLAAELGVRVSAPAFYDRLRAVQEALVARLERGGRTLLVLDEAQGLPDDTLEAVRLLATLEAGPRARPLQLLLVGQPELDRRLRRPRWRALSQRIGARARLRRLGRGEALDYLHARLLQARPAAPGEVFSPHALDAVAASAGGAPRRLDRLARGALERGWRAGERPVRPGSVRRALRELHPGEGAPGWAAALGGAGAVAAAVGLGWLALAQGGARRIEAAGPQLARAAEATAPAPISAAPPLRAAMALSPPEPTPEPPPVADLRPPVATPVLAPELRPSLR